MRCQKVRFYLSAFCRDELPDGRRKAVAAHLEKCSECRREEAEFYELVLASRRTADYGVSADFNSALLSRIAAERFKETRSKAYFPKRIPIVSWGRVVPVLATACLIVAFVVTGGVNTILRDQQPDQTAYIPSSSAPSNSDYMTVQPQSDHALLQHASVSSFSGSAEWRFQQQLAKVNRMRGLIMSSLAGQKTQPFPGMLGDGLFPFGSNVFIGIPFQFQPSQGSVSGLVLPESLTVKEARQAY